jgi:hypothetical protein
MLRSINGTFAATSVTKIDNLTDYAPEKVGNFG